MNKLFIYSEISNLTGSYHDSGGLIICAKDIDEAKEVYAQNIGKDMSDKEYSSIFSAKLKLEDLEKPDKVIETKEKETFAIGFPDAGCC